MKVLVVDRSQLSRTLIQQELGSTGFTFLEATSSEEALELFRKHQPDLITTGYWLPDDDGLKMAEKIRSNADLMQPPLILITGLEDQALHQRAFAAGVSEFFPKHFLKGQLRRYVAQLFAQEDALKKLPILLISASPQMHAVVKRILELAGATVSAVDCIDDALRQLHSSERAELVIVDQHNSQPASALCLALREQVLHYPLPILVLTRPETYQPNAVLLQAGANDLLATPFQREELLARVRNHAQLIRYHQRLDKELAQRRLREEQLRDELTQARETQRTLLPQSLPEIDGVETAYTYEPMEEIGGDLCDVFALSPTRLGLMIADVTGHGVPAALISFMVSSAFSQNATTELSCSETLRRTNDLLHERISPDKFATLFYAIYDTQTRQLSYASAGHPHALILRHGRDVMPLSTKGLFLGPFPSEMLGIQEHTITLEPDDKLLLYTDALTEAMNQQGQMLGTGKLAKILRYYSKLPIGDFLENVYDALTVYVSDHKDDCTLVGMQVL